MLLKIGTAETETGSQEARGSAPTGAGQRAERRAQSFLVRVWQESGGSGEAAGPIRCYVRNLRTGDEAYVPRAEDLTAFLTLQLGCEDARDDGVVAAAGAACGGPDS